ncbi:hypothetical protein ACRS6K_18910 [Bacillus cytotoxicus]
MLYGLETNREEGESRYRFTELAICNPFFMKNNEIGRGRYMFAGQCKHL